MTWTTPRTYTVGDVLTAADMNTYQRDNLAAALPNGTTEQTYTPTLTASSSSPSLGSGSSAAGQYQQVGNLAVVSFRFTFGSSGTAAGSGNYQVSLPLSFWSSLPDGTPLGSASIYDSSASTRYVGQAFKQSTVAQFVVDGGNVVTSSTPFSWGANDQLWGHVVYPVSV